MPKQTKEATSEAKPQNAGKVTVDGVEYEFDKLSQAAKNLLVNINATDGEIRRLRTQVGIAEAARQLFGEKLKAELGKGDADA